LFRGVDIYVITVPASAIQQPALDKKLISISDWSKGRGEIYLSYKKQLSLHLQIEELDE